MKPSKNIIARLTNRPPCSGPVRRGPLAALAAGILLCLIQLYRWLISPAQTFLFGADSGCRFTPTCSQYALEAIHQHGAGAGSLLALKRICRCHPLGGCGHDPVPAHWLESVSEKYPWQSCGGAGWLAWLLLGHRFLSNMLPRRASPSIPPRSQSHRRPVFQTRSEERHYL